MTCRDIIVTPLPTVDPYNPESVLTPGWVVDTESNRAAFSILIYVGSTPYEFNQYYAPPTMRIEEYRGAERGKATFTVTDFSPDQVILPFVPSQGMRVVIRNFTGDDTYMDGQVATVDPTLIVRREDMTEVTAYNITVSDQSPNLERKLVFERYTNVPVGFIIKDLIRRYTFFDDSAIDPTQGVVLQDFRLNGVYVAQAIERLLDIEQTWTYYIDPATGQFLVGDISDPVLTVLNVNDSDVYEYFNAPDLKLNLDDTSVRNRVYFPYKTKYNTGTVSVLQGESVVFGQGTLFLGNVQAGARLVVNGSTAAYTVEEPETDLQLRISSPFQESDILTGVPFVIINEQPQMIIVEDTASIARMAAINNETSSPKVDLQGVYEYIVPLDNAAYTREEAYQVANSHLVNYTDPIVVGSAKTDNTKLNFANLHAGQAIEFNLPISKKVVATMVMQKLVKQDTGAVIERDLFDDTPTDPRIDPFMVYEMDFRDRMFDLRNQIKRLGSDVRRLDTADDTEIFITKIFGERIFVDDCLEVGGDLAVDLGTEEIYVTDLTQINPPMSFDEEIGVEDTVTLLEPIVDSPYHIQPVSGGISAGYIVGLTRYSEIA